MTPKRPTKPTILRYHNGIIRADPRGYRAEVNHAYKRHRRRCRTIEEARAWIDDKQIEIANGQRPLDAFALSDARLALERLPPGVRILDAVDFYLRHQARANARAVTLSNAVETFIADKRAAGLRDRSIWTLTTLLNALVKQAGDRNLASITIDDMQAVLRTRKLAPRSRDGFRRAWSNFFGWAIRAGYIETNPADALSRAQYDDTPPGILTVAQAEALLRHAPAVLVPYLAIGMFAGVRPSELAGLRGDDIGETICIGPGIAKMRRQRYVSICDNLREWLDAVPPDHEAVLPLARKPFQDAFREARTAAGIDEWPSDAMRHSFATYHLALHRNAALTAHELGHGSSTDMLFRHYRALATRADGDAYFNIRPAIRATLT